MRNFLLNDKTGIHTSLDITKPIQHALNIFLRDMRDVFGREPEINSQVDDGDLIILEIKEDLLKKKAESFSIRFEQKEQRVVMRMIGSDELGIIYGLLHISKEYLGVDPFWFWADIKVKPQKNIYIPVEDYDSPQPKVRFRGWFVNDEVCLIGWKKPYPPTKEVWQPVFEALLRSGGNMVIPGTDLPKEGVHFELASEMGLWITHHHAEPLGAEMFLRAYPGKQASYLENTELYEQLWREAIQKQKDKKIVWVLSFRGQGDQPFWIQDPSFDTSEKRGQLISKVMSRQLEMIKEYVEDPVTCVALYGEISELYKGGYIELPDNVIKIWADNGYGKMVSRRNGNESFRIPSMPEKEDQGRQGIYYHITFHDLQASNHLTMFPSPPLLIKEELMSSFQGGGDDYLLLNSGNIRMHLYTIDIVNELWNKGEIDLDQHLNQFVNRLYSSNHTEIANLYEAYFNCTIRYGRHEDDRAGDEFYHHPARKIISHWMQGKEQMKCEKLHWATPDANTFFEQIESFKKMCESGLAKWSALREKSMALLDQLNAEDQLRFYDQFMIQVELHYSGCKGFISLCESYIFAEEDNYPLAFVHASQAIWDYQLGLKAMERSEHGNWENFYQADWLTNVKWTIESLETLRKYLRMHGDSPDFFAWYKEYIMPETEKYIYLENTHRNPLSDDELARKLQNKMVGM